MALPPHVYAPETPLQELGTAELFLVSVARLWLARRRDPDGAGPDWRAGFRAADIGGDGAGAFVGLCRIVGVAARRRLDVRRRADPILGVDEAWFLRIVSLLQHGRAADAAAILTDWLPTAAVRLALPQATRLAAALDAAGLRVPLRHGEAGRRRPHGPAAAAARGLDLVH